jgi:bifunctional DNase/RNase
MLKQCSSWRCWKKRCRILEVFVNAVIEDQQWHTYVVLLKEKFGERTLPIWIGESEAMAIALTLEGVKPKRPLTHDLLKSILDAFQAKVSKIGIVDLKEETYYAKIFVEVDSKVYAIDARPSDSIALALRTKSSIWVNDEILGRSGIVLQGDKTIDELRRRLRNTKPESFGEIDFNK